MSGRSSIIARRTLRGLAAAALAGLCLVASSVRGASTAETIAPTAAADSADGAGAQPKTAVAGPASGVFAAAVSDPVAARYLNSCAGCHSLAGVKLNGPELSPVASWPLEQLRVAIKKMEPKVGPLADADVDSLALLLQQPDVRTRLDAEAERIRARFAATMEPGNVATGRALFTGRRPLENGGLACTPCHKAGVDGGRLGPDLTTAFDRLGEAPLLSGIENANYRVMSAHYGHHPITKQEALHIATYLATFTGESSATGGEFPILPAAMLSVLGLLGMVMYGRRGRSGRRASPRKER